MHGGSRVASFVGEGGRVAIMEEMERPRGVKMIHAAGRDPLSTSHRGKGLYG